MGADSGLERLIGDAMAQVRGARVDPDTADTVDESLRALCQSAEDAGAEPGLTVALRNAEVAFKAGDTVEAIQCLSRALIQVTRLPGSGQKKGKR
jgi:hypothetical protein